MVLLFSIAILMGDHFSLTLVYLFVGVIAAGLWWNRRSLAQLQHKRQFNSHAFLGEKIAIRLHIHNRGFLPILWTSVQDSLPVSLSVQPFFQQILSLGPGAETDFHYTVYANKRGYYPVGPLFIVGGDLFGLSKPVQLNHPAEYLTVYPNIIPLSSVQIPSRSPQGTLRHHQQIFEDPSRLFGKREYTHGDSLRRVDWKASASSGRLQVKIFEPSIALETLIFLDLNNENYNYRHRSEATELAIVIAASLAAWVVGKRQSVGLNINGQDPLAENGIPQYVPPRKGQAQLMRMLEVLARIQAKTQQSLVNVVRQQRHHLAWGTTLMVITGLVNDDLLGELHQARRAGQNVALILAGPADYETSQNTLRRAAHFGIPLISIHDENGLDVWRT